MIERVTHNGLNISDIKKLSRMKQDFYSRHFGSVESHAARGLNLLDNPPTSSGRQLTPKETGQAADACNFGVRICLK
jgi:hypothetical protein